MPEIALIGRYWPGTSPLHRMDPRAKLLLSLGSIGVIFCAQTFFGLMLCAFCIISFFICATIPLKKALQSITPLLFIVIITALLNVFFVQGGTTLFQWSFVQISEGGLYQAAFIACRLFLLLLTMSLLTLTTSTLDITDAFEYLLTPFARVGLPAHELSMIMGIALRFLPQFIFESQTIYRAQISRGAHFSSSLKKGSIALIGALVVPLFTSAFRHAETLSAGMDARCYHGASGRTRLHPLRYSALDRNAVGILMLWLVCVVATNVMF